MSHPDNNKEVSDFNKQIIDQLNVEDLSEAQIAELLNAFLSKLGKSKLPQEELINQLFSGNLVKGNENTTTSFCNIIITNEDVLSKLVDMFSALPESIREEFFTAFLNKKKSERNDMN